MIIVLLTLLVMLGASWVLYGVTMSRVVARSQAPGKVARVTPEPTPRGLIGWLPYRWIACGVVLGVGLAQVVDGRQAVLFVIVVTALAVHTLWDRTVPPAVVPTTAYRLSKVSLVSTLVGAVSASIALGWAIGVAI